jgi:hypothetical protein
VVTIKLILNDCTTNEIIDYLLTQEGIIDVKRKEIDYVHELEIKHNDKITPSIVLKFVNLFQNNTYSILLEFDKETKENVNKFSYVVDDLCCDYCYMNLVEELFENKYIKSVKSNYNITTPAVNIEFIIEYNHEYSKEDIIKFIEERK